MKQIRRQTFVVVEGSTVVGSFVDLSDAFEFRAKSGSRYARIHADHGEFDQARFQGPRSKSVWMPQPMEGSRPAADGSERGYPDGERAG